MGIIITITFTKSNLLKLKVNEVLDLVLVVVEVVVVDSISHYH